ncbi:glycoside hydrolase family 3 C-terminal domain-containing protein [bacterium]|nr:glycoside hydrolase family 3 C-terminal domain-containing protein [bacterium]
MKPRLGIFILAAVFLVGVEMPARSDAFDADNPLEARIEGIISRMSIEEKILQLHHEGGFDTKGNVRLGVPGFIMADGPHGVRDGQATCFPVGIAMAASWDTAMVYRIGEALGREFRGKGKHQGLGPCADLCWDPRNGRSPETGGEDPFLCGMINASLVRGMQSTLCIATVKHYCVENKQDGRTTNNAIASQRMLMDHYGTAFRLSVQTGGAWSVMNAYTLVNGEKCAENDNLLETILRQRWGFPFYVVSDWGSIWSSQKAIEAGCDVCMGSDHYQDDLPALVRGGSVSEETINRAVRRVLRTKMISGIMDTYPVGNPEDVNSPAHQALCLEAGRKSIVLLKNEGGLLPLDKNGTGKIAVIGPSADAARLDGQGSSVVTPFYSITPLVGIRSKVGSSRVLYAKGCDINSSSTAGFADAAARAAQAQAVIYIGGLDDTQEGEGLDRVGGSIALPGVQQDLINTLADANPNLVVVLESGGICSISRCIDNIPALMYAFYPGQEGGNAIADVLFGDINPGGKLPVTMPVSDSQLPPRNLNFNDDFGCGYRWFDEKGFTPQFAFGHGLSYTTFEYSNMLISPQAAEAGRKIIVRADVKNTGFRNGDEVVQLYLSHPEIQSGLPEKQLRGFRRIALSPGEKRTVEFELTAEDLYTFNEAGGSYRVEPGVYGVKAGGSSGDLPLSGTFAIQPASLLPDLEIAHVLTVPPYPVRGDSVLFLAQIVNRGTGPSRAGVVHSAVFRMNGDEAGRSDHYLESIPAGGSALLCSKACWTAGSTGSYMLEVCLDEGGIISECLEDNNKKTVPLTVHPRPPENLALNKSVTVSSVEREGLEGGMAVDGDMSTRWSSAFSDPQWIKLDLGEATAIDQVLLFWETAYAKEYKIQVSNDGLGWTTQADVTAGDGGIDRLDIRASGRYVRMLGIKRATEWGYSLWEFQVLASSGVEDREGPSDFRLYPNSPNPFNSGTSIHYELPASGPVELVILDMAGRHVRSLVGSVQQTGAYTVTWDGMDDGGERAPSGLYICRLRAGGFEGAGKMMRVR